MLLLKDGCIVLLGIFTELLMILGDFFEIFGIFWGFLRDSLRISVIFRHFLGITEGFFRILWDSYGSYKIFEGFFDNFGDFFGIF